jgi:membrane protease YdiL (CAAX protease family)
LVLLALGLQLALAIPLGIIDVVVEQGLHRPSPQLERQPLIIGLVNIVAIGVPIAVGLRLNRLSFRRAFAFPQPAARQLGSVGLSVLGACVLLSEADNVFRSFLPPPRWLQNAMKELFFTEGKLLSRILLLVIIAPATEELLFRGLILRGLLSRHRPAVAALLTALLFAALHANPWQLLSAFFLGVVLAWFYLRTGSVLLCVIGHAIANGLMLFCSLVSWNIPGLTGTPNYSVTVFQPLWVDISGLVIFVLGLWMFHYATDREFKIPNEPPQIGDQVTDSTPPI